MDDKKWIDFKLVKEAVSMEMLCLHYGLSDFQRNGTELRGRCPFHNSKSGRTLAVNLDKNTFYCFGCKTRGNVLDFVAKMEPCNVRDAALKLDEWFNVTAQTAEESDNTQPAASVPVINGTPLPGILIAEIETRLARLKQLLATS